MIVGEEEEMFSIFGFLSSKVCKNFLRILSPTMSFTNSELQRLPIAFDSSKGNIKSLTKENYSLSSKDRSSYETSWDFTRHPLVSVQKSVTSAQNTDFSTSAPDSITTAHPHSLAPSTYEKQAPFSSQVAQSRTAKSGLLSWQYEQWKQECDQRFAQLKANEEELNRIFIDIYGLQDELTPEVADRDITVHRIFDSKDEVPESMRGSNYVRTKRDEIVSLISYAVGCMFGRYSLDVDGLAYAGGEWDPSKYASFPADKDNIIPICDDVYFEDDIVGRFVDFVKIVYGADTLEENLRFIADALGGKGQPREVIRNYFLKDFYKDHCKTYQKRPIYWLFDSGRKNGFKCLIYMHRYRSDTIARIRTDYVHEQQARYRTAIEDLENRIAQGSAGESVRLKKQLKMRGDQAAEIHAYEEKIHHLADRMISINLDDGVKHNYAIFQDVLAKIR